MEPLGIIGIVVVGIAYVGLNLFGFLANIGCDHWNSGDKNRAVARKK